MATTKKTSTKTKSAPRAKKDADPDVDYSTGLVDHMQQGNEYVPPAEDDDES